MMKGNFSIQNLNAWQSLILSFTLLIIFGTFLLLMPFVVHKNGLNFTDALFTSTSAVCVTGLTTVNTSGFNLGGQLVILLLIQMGAIGIMTLTSSFLLAIRGNIGLKHRLSFSRLQENYELQDANSILRNIIRITFIIEFIGFVLLSIGFLMEGEPLVDALYQGFFHSISAFCNAGFSTYDTSLIGMNVLIKYTISLLIIMGGIGYFVIYEVTAHYKRGRSFSLHTKIVIISSSLLVLLGALFFYFFEEGNVGITDSIFQSVTARTAGFNSIKMGEVSYAGAFLLMLLMFIGASPGSTGGGIKTTTFFVIINSIISVLKGKSEVVIFNRKISSKTILKSFATVIIYFVIITIGVLILLQEHQLNFETALFEAVSAMGTVGLSMGITPTLTEIGKIVIIALMFIGRLGPASLAMATVGTKKEVKINYPESSLY